MMNSPDGFCSIMDTNTSIPYKLFFGASCCTLEFPYQDKNAIWVWVVYSINCYQMHIFNIIHLQIATWFSSYYTWISSYLSLEVPQDFEGVCRF